LANGVDQPTRGNGPRAVEPGRPTISTHVLDTTRGRPADGIHVTLYRLDLGEKPARMTQALTDADGRVRDLLERPLAEGDYRLEFRLPAERSEFFGQMALDIHVRDTGRSYHVPVLISPFGLTTYRGS
jgi:5-hydroxyisourate hydrolase